MALETGFESIITKNQPLSGCTRLGLGGPAEFFAQPTNLDELKAIVVRCREEGAPVRLLGGGSNILVRDEGTPGMVIRLSAPAFTNIKVVNNTVVAGGGARLGHTINAAVGKGLAGLEMLVGIPGTIAGALCGNAQSRGGDIGQRTRGATVLTRTGEIHQRSREDLVFAYRQSNLDELVIIEGTFELEETDPDELTKRMQKHWIVKKSEQPLTHQRTGYIFKNPRGMNAGTLIEQAGLKGTRIGALEVSQRHANFIIAENGATSRDALRLIDLVRTRVAERLDVELETEIEIW